MVVRYALIGTLVLQTELQRRDFNGPYVPISEYADLATLRFRPPPNDVSEDDGDNSTTPPAESVGPSERFADALVSELIKLTSALALGGDADLDRMIVLSTAIKLELSPRRVAESAAISTAATSASAPVHPMTSGS
eukprot:1094181-Pleurochrysis_carterae.AAC.1